LSRQSDAHTQVAAADANLVATRVPVTLADRPQTLAPRLTSAYDDRSPRCTHAGTGDGAVGKEQLQRIVELIQAVPYWEQTAQLKAMASVLLNRYEHCSDSERAAEIRRIRILVEQLLTTDPLILAHEALLAAEENVCELPDGEPV
jgi:hypothetical protein